MAERKAKIKSLGVYIKDMEMPKNCAVCPLEKDIFGRAVCFAIKDGKAIYEADLPSVEAENRRPSWCPLVLKGIIIYPKENAENAKGENNDTL